MRKQIRLLCALLAMCAMLTSMIVAGAEETPITVTEIQKYGNLVLSVKGSEMLKEYAYGDIVTAWVNGQAYDMPVAGNYADVDNGKMVCRVVFDEATGEDYVIVAINMGDFATTAKLAVKTKTEEAPGYVWDVMEGVETPVSVRFSMKEAGGYYDQWLMRQITRTNERTDYAALTDAEFANFRAIATTGMGKGVLYRTSSPVNPEIGRNAYADAAAREAGIKTILNLADAESVLTAYEGYAETYYAQQNVCALNLGVDFSAEDFKTGLASGLRFLIGKEGPYLVHCTEGKDRAGFVSGVLECLMGASAEEVVADYMTTYINYYGVEKDSEQYALIAASNIKASLAQAFGVADITAEDVDLSALAKAYLVGQLGLSEDEVNALVETLS